MNTQMNKSVNPLHAFVILIVFGGLIALKFYFYGKAVEIPSVSSLKVSPSGTLNIKLGTDLFEYTSEGIYKKKTNLNQFGVVENIGDFDFFSNGDLLINRDDFLPTIKDKLNSFARLQNTDQTVSDSGKGLQRCNLQTSRCVSFSRKIPALKGAYYIYIDRTKDDVYLADTSRHAVRKLDKSGELLAEIKSGLKFPNQVYLEENKLWIVDTNHHVMKAVDASNDNFGDVIEQHETIIKDLRIWPSAFSKVENRWWVNISNNSMSNAKIVIFDSNWKDMEILNLPENADPVVSVKFNDSVIIADDNLYALYRFDLSGNRIADIVFNEKADGIKAALQENKEKHQEYIFWSDLTFWAGIVLFSLLFAYALMQASKDKEEALENNNASNDKNKVEISRQHILDLAKLPMEGEWIEAKSSIKYIKWIPISLGILLVFSYVSIFTLLKDELTLEMIVIFISIPIAFALGAMPVVKLSRYKIGFFKNKVMIQTHDGKLISTPYDEVKWSDRMFMVNDWVVPIGNPSQSIFPYQEIVKKLMPYVKPNNKLNAVEALKYQWRSPEGGLKFIMLMMAILMVMILFIEQQKISAFFAGIV